MGKLVNRWDLSDAESLALRNLEVGKNRNVVISRKGF
jgi:hypothetical protein